MATTSPGPGPPLATPGQILGTTAEYRPGPGTHLHASHIQASIAGIITTIAPAATAPHTKVTAQKPLLAISPNPPFPPLTSSDERQAGTPAPAHGPNETATKSQASNSAVPTRHVILPEVNSQVLARVTKINPRQATVSILVVGDQAVSDGIDTAGAAGSGGEDFQGVIRVQDVRATEKDKVKIFSSFRPGDIVRAVVISLGDQSNYYLSTASNALGVIMAKAEESGNAMYPISWREFRDPVTGVVEARKVAKPF
ncbi:MAG: exosome 3'-_5 exonuclease subunit ski4 (Csl4) [Thelocarpon superellum]|nr:MAG: exosome 3'->5 exonuclease subunit ski4 (Csl4) [Thelocarpon superellum]